MKGLKLDFKKIGMETAGNAVGLMAVQKVGAISFVQNLKTPVIKGLVMLGIGRIAIPFLAGKAGLAGKKGGAFVEGVSQSVSTYGIGQILSNTAATKALVPTISGYEDGVYGMGLITNDESVNGFEDAVNGYEDGVYGQPNEDVYE